MLKHYVEIDIPYETVCTLRQACEYIAFDWKPTNNEKYEQYLNRYNSSNFNQHEYDLLVSKAKNLLGALFEKGDIPMTGIEDPAEPLWPGDDEYTISHNDLITQQYAEAGYLPWEHNDRVPVVKPQKWRFDIDANWIINQTQGEGTSYREILIQMNDLEAALSRKVPTKTYELQWDGKSIYVTDGTLLPIHLKTFRDDAKTKPVWDYIMANPDKEITREELVERFSNIDPADDISMIPRNNIENKDILNGCFPILKSDVIKFVPRFTNLDIKRD